MSEKKEKITTWKENEAPIGRWILTLVLGVAVGIVASVTLTGVVQLIKKTGPFMEGGSMYEAGNMLQTVAGFIGLFIAQLIFIKCIAKTSIRAFIFGADRPKKGCNIKRALPIIGLALLGLIVVSLFTIKNIEYTGKSAGTIIVIVIIATAFAWMQTSWEEIVFRGIPLRAVCKNDIKPCKKAIITSLITSVLFMIMHVANQEVMTKKGIEVVFMMAIYFVMGFLMALFDMFDGDLFPGLVMHWINNYFNFVIIYGTVSGHGATSIWIDTTQASGFYSFVATLIAYVPLTIYMIIRYVRKKKANA